MSTTPVTTVFDAVINRALALLRADPPLVSQPSINVTEDISAAEMPPEVEARIIVSLGQARATPAALSGAPTDWLIPLRVDCVARQDLRTQSTTSTLARASSLLFAQVHARIMGEPTFGGVALMCDVQQAGPDYEVADSRIGCFTGIYNIRARTAFAAVAPL